MARILIIDDEEGIRTAVVKLLEIDDHEVTTAADGEKGLRKFREMPTDIVITDLMMPNKEGLETIMDLRKIAPDVKIIAISGGGRLKNTQFLGFADALGANATLTKPFELNQLCSIVNDCLDDIDCLLDEK